MRASDSKPCQTRAQVTVKKEQGVRLANGIDDLQVRFDRWKHSPLCCSFLTRTTALKQCLALESDHPHVLLCTFFEQAKVIRNLKQCKEKNRNGSNDHTKLERGGLKSYDYVMVAIG